MYDEDEFEDHQDGLDERARSFPAFPPGKRSPRKFARTWWGNAWIEAMEDTALDPEQLKKGRKYAYAGHVGLITVSPGRISAEVHDGDHYTPYQTVVRIDELSDLEWDRFLTKVASKAGHIAALLDKEMPPDLVRSADDAGVKLLPSFGDLDPDCDCPGWELPCKHAAALSYQASWLLDTDPLVLLLMRGRGEEELIAELRRRNERRDATATTQQRTSGVDAAEAYRSTAAELPAPPLSTAGAVQDVGALLAEVELSEDAFTVVDPVALGRLVDDAAQWARSLCRSAPDPRVAGEWPDAVRFAAGGLPEDLRARLGVAAGGRDLARAVRAWELAGAAGLEVLEHPWAPDRLTVARVNDELRQSREQGVLEATAEAKVWRNRWTFPGESQLRLGRDELWYPFRAHGGVWWPAGSPERDLLSAAVEVTRWSDPESVIA